MAQRWFPTSNGKGWYTLDSGNAEDWFELMKNANGVPRITSVNQRAAAHHVHQQAQDGEDPTPQE